MVLTDFGELETLPANARAVLLSHMSDIRQLIEFGRSNLERRRFLKRHRVFPMWFKRQCGFPEDMSDQEANMRIETFLSSFTSGAGIAFFPHLTYRDLPHYKYDSRLIILNNYWSHWGIEFIPGIGTETLITRLKDAYPSARYSHGSYNIITSAKYPIFDLFRLFELCNTPLTAYKVSSINVSFSCSDPFDVMAFVTFRNLCAFSGGNPLNTYVPEFKQTSEAFTKLNPPLTIQHPQGFYNLVQSRLLEGKIKLSELYFETRVSCSGSLWTM